MMDGNKNGIVALGDDGDSGSLGVDLFPLGDGEADLLERRVRDLVSFSEALCLIFIAENVVSVFKDCINFVSIELNQETCREVIAKGLVMLRGKASVVQESIVVRGDKEG